ncbi:hypothetical protein WDU94_012130 [Cyamophila willieti]
MVMEVPPSPQCVGREFVRQYYTLLNQAPAHLHRFYSENSLFIHGGLDVPNRETKQVVGQEQIHEHIQQLNFRDCHAKISQVDSQATLGNGVVVQVSGELSNAGQPMRRFTQTFVLAAQSPKKYYVHNDIFRYQDLLVLDEETDLSRSEEGEDEAECESSAEINQNGQGEDYYSGGSEINNGGSHQLIEETPPSFPPPPAVTQPVQELPPTPVPVPAPVVAPVPTQQFPTVKQVEDNVVSPPPQVQAEPAPPSPVKEEDWGDTTSSPPAPSPPPVISNEPKTYANLLKGSSNSSYSNQNSSAYQRPQSPPPSVQKPSEHIHSSRDHLPPRSSLPPSSQPRGPRPGPGGPRGGMRDRPPQRASFSEDNDSEKSMGYRGGPAPPRHSQGGGGSNFVTPNGVQYNDNQQLFMGNIPLTAQEEELRALFGQFGTILDLKIFSKPTTKGPRVPNYGFLIYEDPNTVQTVLLHRPIYFPNAKDPNGVKLNVEEKKRRNPGPPDSRPPMDSRPRGGGLSMRGGRGGPRGGGGGMYRGGDSNRGGNLPPNSNMSGGLRNSTSNNGFNKGR